MDDEWDRKLTNWSDSKREKWEEEKPKGKKKKKKKLEIQHWPRLNVHAYHNTQCVWNSVENIPLNGK